MPNDDMVALAESLMDLLRPGCARIEIAGSIRRGSERPRDIELVAISLPAPLVYDLFGELRAAAPSPLEERVATVLALGEWEMDYETKRDGPRYKRLRHRATRVSCDLFITTAERWGVIFAIRTGPYEYARQLATLALKRGMRIEDGYLWRKVGGSLVTVPTPEEADFFRELGCPLLAPEERRAEALTSAY